VQWETVTMDIIFKIIVGLIVLSLFVLLGVDEWLRGTRRSFQEKRERTKGQRRQYEEEMLKRMKTSDRTRLIIIARYLHLSGLRHVVLLFMVNGVLGLLILMGFRKTIYWDAPYFYVGVFLALATQYLVAALLYLKVSGALRPYMWRAFSLEDDEEEPDDKKAEPAARGDQGAA